MTADIVLGLNFGDEGKGLVTSYLCSKYESIVIRFNGGHQVGHTVNYNGVCHVFSNFGSGTLQGYPTFWSKYCTIYPLSFINELQILNGKGINPVFYCDPECPVTTPWDVIANHHLETKNNHGSVGVGFGQTIKRNEETNYRLYIRDLFHPIIFNQKLKAIQKYYNIFAPANLHDSFMHACSEIQKHIHLCTINKLPKTYHLIFEGAQGILLDQNYGFFPNVTRSNTTSKNVFEIIKTLNVPLISLNVNYVTRSYLTRHGNGFFPSNGAVELINNELETNVYNYQGEFRTTKLDLDLINYSLTCDRYWHPKNLVCDNNLFITCMDQHEFPVSTLPKFDINNVYISRGPSWYDIDRVPLY